MFLDCLVTFGAATIRERKSTLELFLPPKDLERRTFAFPSSVGQCQVGGAVSEQAELAVSAAGRGVVLVAQPKTKRSVNHKCEGQAKDGDAHLIL
jgi:hypothetical protein